MRALQIHAGPRALRHLREQGLRPQDVAMVPGAAGGPKGLILHALDRWLFGEWLPQSAHTVHLIGASIGAWRLASACLPDPVAGLLAMAEAEIVQTYDHAPGQPPTARHVSEIFASKLALQFGGHEAALLAHPRYRLHVVTSRGRHLLGREGRLGARLLTPMGYLGAAASNALSRRALGAWLERVIFSDPREPLPLHCHDFRTRSVALTADNLRAALQASCSIPFVLEPVRDPPGAPPGAYWDGGITDYHLHLDYASMRIREPATPDSGGLVLYPHFQRTLVPGWLDKGLRHRHHASARLDNVVVVSPTPDWVRSLPNGKLPDRTDFRRYGDDEAARIAAWRRATGEAQRLADEFAERVSAGAPILAEPL